jgi:hypothetical protein
VPVRIVNGRLVTACQISAIKRLAVNLFIDYDAPHGLLLHNKAAAGIESEQADGTPNKITVHLPDISLEVAQREHGDEAFFEHFTKWFSKDLGENAVVGVLGARVLPQYHITFDLPSGFIELSQPRPISREPVEEVAGSETTPITVHNGLAWVRVAYGNGRAGALGIATSRYDSWVDVEHCEELGRRAGDIGPVTVGALDLAPYIPFRPEPIRHTHPDGVFGMTGLNLLEHFRVEVDRNNLWARWTPTVPPRFAQADLEFYKARLDEKPEPIEAWLDKNPDARLVPEAAMLLLDMRIEKNADEPSMRKALGYVYSSWPADLKATGALELLQKMLQSGRPTYALAAGELGLAKGRDDRYPDSVHMLRARMGSIQLQQGNPREAWKNLLSAALGLPEDGPLNLDLARCYEMEGRHTRAFSRYLQALLRPDSGPEAIAGVERVLPKLQDAESFSVDTIQRLIEGKVEGFGSATKFVPEEGAAPSRAVLVEFFGNAHVEGLECGVLARDGLRDHFGEHCVLVAYSAPEPELEPLVNELSTHMWEKYGNKRIGHKADGVVGLPAGGKIFMKQAVFDACRRAITQRLQKPSDYKIEMEAKADRKGIRGSASFRGPQKEDVIAQVLFVEKGVLFPGRSLVVIHRNVARAALTEKVEGVAFDPAGGAMKVQFDRTWDSIVAANSAFLDEQVKKGGSEVSKLATRIDPQQARVVAILRDRKTGEVLQAAQLDPTPGEGLK